VISYSLHTFIVTILICIPECFCTSDSFNETWIYSQLEPHLFFLACCSFYLSNCHGYIVEMLITYNITFFKDRLQKFFWRRNSHSWWLQLPWVSTSGQFWYWQNFDFSKYSNKAFLSVCLCFCRTWALYFEFITPSIPNYKSFCLFKI